MHSPQIILKYRSTTDLTIHNSFTSTLNMTICAESCFLTTKTEDMRKGAAWIRPWSLTSIVDFDTRGHLERFFNTGAAAAVGLDLEIQKELERYALQRLAKVKGYGNRWISRKRLAADSGSINIKPEQT